MNLSLAGRGRGGDDVYRNFGMSTAFPLSAAATGKGSSDSSSDISESKEESISLGP
jgi:hypothetical protein